MIKGFTCGCFDLLHAGHIVMLKETKENCDYLIVGLQTDPSIDRKEKNPPVQSVYERFVQLNAVKYVDEIIPYDTEESLIDLLESTPSVPHIANFFPLKSGNELKYVSSWFPILC